MTFRSRPGHPYLAGAPLLFAHRGGANLAPENTLEAFRNSVDLWDADVLELDVRRTLDGELIVFHDPVVDRTTDGSGAVADLPWSEVGALNAGYHFRDLEGRFSFRGRGVRVPRIRDLLEAFPQTRMNVDAKDPSVQPELVKLVEELGAEHRVLLASADRRGRADRFGYRGPVSATRHQIRLFYFLHRLPRGGGYCPRADALQIPYEWKGRQVTTPQLIREAHRRNIAVHVWTVDEPELMRRLLAWGVDGIQTDRPDLLSMVLHEEVGRPLPPGHRKETDAVEGGSSDDVS